MPTTVISARCDRHVGELYPPRCADCDSALLERDRPPLVGIYSSTECPDHPGYYVPCDRCWRDHHEAPPPRE